MKVIYFCTFLSITLILACNKEVTVDNTDKNFPLTLSYSVANGSKLFTWDEVNVTNFEKYILVSSGKEIAKGGTPFDADKNIVFESSNYDDTSASSASAILFDSVGYYKLYAKVGERWLESQSIRLANENVVVSGIPLASVFLPDSNWVLVFKLDNGANTGKLNLVDLNNNKVYSSSLSFPFNSLDQIAICFTYKNGQPEAVFSTSSTLRRFSLPNLVSVGQIVTSSAPFSAVQGSSNILITTNGAVSTALNVRKYPDLTVVKSHTRSNYFEPRTLGVLDTATNLFVETSQSRTDIFSINPITGLINSGSISIAEPLFGAFLHEIPMTADRKYFCPGPGGNIYDWNLQLKGNLLLGSQNSNLTDVAFSPDGEYVFTINNNFTNAVKTLKQHRFSDQSLVKSTNLPTNFLVQRLHFVKKGLVMQVQENSTTSKFTYQFINY